MRPLVIVALICYNQEGYIGAALDSVLAQDYECSSSSSSRRRHWHRTYGLPVVITNCSNNGESTDDVGLQESAGSETRHASEAMMSCTRHG